jgi:hypothetical protein
MPWNARDDAPDTDRFQEAFRSPNESSRIAAGIYYLVVQVIFETAAVLSEQQQLRVWPSVARILRDMAGLHLIRTYAEDDKVVGARFRKSIYFCVAADRMYRSMARREQQRPRIQQIRLRID